jgi:hypothetical protein
VGSAFWCSCSSRWPFEGSSRRSSPGHVHPPPQIND